MDARDELALLIGRGVDRHLPGTPMGPVQAFMAATADAILAAGWRPPLPRVIRPDRPFTGVTDDHGWMTIPHGLGKTPQSIMLTPTEAMSRVAPDIHLTVTSIGSSSVTAQVWIDAMHVASAGTAVEVEWAATL